MNPVTPESVSDESEIRKVVRDILDALLELHFHTTPDVGGSVVGGGVSGGGDLGRESVPQALDPARIIWRRMERNEIKKLRDQAKWIRERCRGTAIQGPPTWRCSGCGTRRKGTDKFCGSCSTPRPQEPPMKQESSKKGVS